MPRIKVASTMKDVAKQAGVSTATVSRAFSHPERLSAPTRHRVEEAVISCGYSVLQPTYAAESKIILVTVTNLRNLIETEVIQGIKEMAAEHNYLLLIHYDAPQNSEETSLQYLAFTRRICGVIQIGNNSYSTWLSKHGMPFLPQITIGHSGYSPYSVTIDIDHFTAAFTAVSNLCQLGYSRIAYLAGQKENTNSYYHEQGYRQALQRWRISSEKHYIIYGEDSFKHGQNSINKLLSLPSPPNAIYCQHDTIAIGAIYQIKQSGLNIPQHLSVIGFGNLEQGQFHSPPLTSVNYPANLIGKQAVNTLIEWLKRPNIKPKPHLFETEIIQRSTTNKRQY